VQRNRAIFLSVFFGLLVFCASVVPHTVHAQELLQDQITTVKARVDSVETKDPKELVGFDRTTPFQTITATILKGERAGETVSFDNDYVQLEKGDRFFLEITTRADDKTVHYFVGDPDRLPLLGFFAILFVLLVVFIGGKQGVRGLVSLIGSFVLILYVLIPGILHGYSPILVAIGVSSLIIVVGSYVTHGFNRTTSCAVAGMIATVIVTGILAYVAVHMARFSGYGSEEAVYLNMNAKGQIDMVGLLLGGIMIGLLGLLYDAAISQAITVEELHHIAPHVERKTIFKRSMRVGREHIGALVDTLAIAYVGASLPLLLLFSQNPGHLMLTLNREIFSAEIIRILIGSIGLVLAVPITTALSTIILVKGEKGDPDKKNEGYKALEQYSHHH
jgi:uncharacterized membrane protein